MMTDFNPGYMRGVATREEVQEVLTAVRNSELAVPFDHLTTWGIVFGIYGVLLLLGLLVGLYYLVSPETFTYSDTKLMIVFIIAVFFAPVVLFVPLLGPMLFLIKRGR